MGPFPVIQLDVVADGATGVAEPEHGRASGSFSYSRGNASGNYAGVVEQAGSGGFDVNVAGNTDLKGAYIASTAAPSKNQFTTGTLPADQVAAKLGLPAVQAIRGSPLGFDVYSMSPLTCPLR